MPRPPRGRPPAQGLSAFEIANANNAVNAFLGPRPAWHTVVSSSSQAQQSSLNTTLVSNDALNSVHTPQTRNHRQSSGAGSPIAVPSSGEHTTSAATILPSPAPTNDLSPSTSADISSPGVANYAIPERPHQSSTAATVQATVSLTGNAIETNHSAGLPRLRRDSQGSDSMTTNSQSVAVIPSTTSSYRTPLTNLLEPTQASGVIGHTQSISLSGPMIGQTTIAGAGTKRNHQETILEHPVKRPRQGLQPSTSYGSQTLSSPDSSLRMWIAAWPNLNDLTDWAVRRRYEFIKLAADEGDWWFLVLHCLYSQRQCRGNFSAQELGVSEAKANDIADSFKSLDSLLPGRTSLNSRHLQCWATFPAETVAQLRLSMRNHVFDGVLNFLSTFCTQWPLWKDRVWHRGFPLMVHELRQMKCFSNAMENIIMWHLATTLGATSGINELQTVLVENRVLESRIDATHLADDLLAARSQMADRYLAIVRQHRSTVEAPHGSSLPSQPSDGLASHRRHEVLPRRQFVNLGPQNGSASQLPSPPTQPVHLLQNQMQAQQYTQSHLRQQERHQPLTSPVSTSLGDSVGVHHQNQPPTSLPFQPQPQVQNTTWSSNMQTQSLRPQAQSISQTFPATSSSGGILQVQPRPVGMLSSGAPATNFGTLADPYRAASQRFASSLEVTSNSTRSSSSTAPAPQAGLPVTHMQIAQFSHSPQTFRTTTPSAMSSAHHAHPSAGQRQQRDGPHPSQGSIIHPTEYPDNPWSWGSLVPGLHLVRERSPIREPREVTGTRFYQFVSDYAAIKTLIPRAGIEIFKFNVDDCVFESLVTMQTRHGLQRCQYGEDSRRVRLRVCTYPTGSQNSEDRGAPTATTHWPENIYVALNGQHLQLRRKQHFRSDWPSELTGMIRKGTNTVSVSLPPSSRHRQGIQKYLLMIEIVSVSSAKALNNRIRGEEHFSKEDTKERLMRRLTGSSDDDVMVQDDFLSISVADPFSSTLCLTPVRSTECKHVECFDLGNWLQTRQAKPSKRSGEPSKVDEWKCPICGDDARPQKLRIDDFFADVTKTLLANGANGTKTIRLDKKGDWSAVVEQDDSEEEEGTSAISNRQDQQTTRRQSRMAPEVISLDDDD